jgi:hypothetical protein
VLALVGAREQVLVRTVDGGLALAVHQVLDRGSPRGADDDQGRAVDDVAGALVPLHLQRLLAAVVGDRERDLAAVLLFALLGDAVEVLLVADAPSPLSTATKLALPSVPTSTELSAFSGSRLQPLAAARPSPCTRDWLLEHRPCCRCRAWSSSDPHMSMPPMIVACSGTNLLPPAARAALARGEPNEANESRSGEGHRESFCFISGALLRPGI